MSEWKELAHFLYGKGFWYADPLREVRGLSSKQLYWVPNENSLPIIWQVGHIAHRESTHIGFFLQGGKGGVLRVPERYEVFGTEWCPIEHLQKWVKSVDEVFAWVADVRAKTHVFIDTLNPEDFHKPAPGADDGLSVAHWLFITTCHTALHIGRIQALRAMIEGNKERAC